MAMMWSLDLMRCTDNETLSLCFQQVKYFMKYLLIFFLLLFVFVKPSGSFYRTEKLAVKGPGCKILQNLTAIKQIAKNENLLISGAALYVNTNAHY